MYVPEQFAVTDRPKQIDFIRSTGWGLLTGVIDGAPFVTHLPFLVDGAAGSEKLIAHMARGNPHWKSFKSGEPQLVVFSGPHAYISPSWYNADKVREMANDWDFSDAGRTRQSNRMRTFADFEKSHGRFVVCDFVCPTKETRENFDADTTIWMDTIKEGRFEDTNKLFQEPLNVDFHITEWNDHNHDDLAKELLKNV